jgi:hypothetical protein
VTFRVAFAGDAAMHFHTLPIQAQDAVVQRAADLAERPWDARILPPGDDPAFRGTVFGDGRGLLSFYLDETEATIRIFAIVWLG